MENETRKDVQVLSQKELSRRTGKVLRLRRTFTDLFPESVCNTHLKIAIMAGIADAYTSGQLAERERKENGTG